MSAPVRADVVVVGAGHAGVQLAVTLAKADPARSVLLVGDEPLLPYERPPLSKRLLSGGCAPEPVLLRSADYWDRSPVVLRTGERVVDVDPRARHVRTEAGATIGYGALVWAAGGSAASCGLPGQDLPGVHSLRDLADLTALRADLDRARSVVIVGGGYIGLEVAAGLRHLGIAVTLVEVATRLLARVTGTVVSGFFTALHRREGVDVRVGVGVERIVARDGRVAGVVLADGAMVPADVVVVGVGMRPHVSALLAAGARGDATGVEVDGSCRTSLTDVYAIGDCVRQPNVWSPASGPVRVESVHNAGQQAGVVARVLAGQPLAPQAPPRFWSTQFDHELRTVGFPAPTDVEVLRGDPDTAAFSVVYLREGRMVALDAVNRPRDFARAQALVAARWEPTSLDEVADPRLELPRLELPHPESPRPDAPRLEPALARSGRG